MDKYSRGDVYREGLQKCREMAAKRIEDLEAKLAKALAALDEKKDE